MLTIPWVPSTSAFGLLVQQAPPYHFANLCIPAVPPSGFTVVQARVSSNCAVKLGPQLGGFRSLVPSYAGQHLTLHLISRFLLWEQHCTSVCKCKFQPFWPPAQQAPPAIPSCSTAPLPWPSSFSWAAHVLKHRRSLLATQSASLRSSRTHSAGPATTKNFQAFFQRPCAFATMYIPSC